MFASYFLTCRVKYSSRSSHDASLQQITNVIRHIQHCRKRVRCEPRFWVTCHLFSRSPQTFGMRYNYRLQMSIPFGSNKFQKNYKRKRVWRHTIQDMNNKCDSVGSSRSAWIMGKASQWSPQLIKRWPWFLVVSSTQRNTGWITKRDEISPSVSGTIPLEWMHEVCASYSVGNVEEEKALRKHVWSFHRRVNTGSKLKT